MGRFTALLAAHRAGDAAATGKLFAEVYTELRRVAAQRLGSAGAGDTLSTTSLVNECYLKLCQSGQLEVNDRQHFLRLAGRVMRQVVVDHARERSARKRGGDVLLVSLDENRVGADEQAASVIELEEALMRLGEIDERLLRVVECRFFAGLREDETAALLDVTVRTVQRDWLRARAWLTELLADPEG